MAITITFSTTNGGASIASPVNFGNVANGATTADQTIYIRHNGTNPITGVGLYLDVADPGTYAGDFTAVNDKLELLLWGDALGAPGFGGYEINLNATASFPPLSWPTLTNKTTVDTLGYVIRNGVGDSLSNLISLPTSTGATSSGTIQTGASPNVRFKARVVIPSSVAILGVRQFKLKIAYNYTS